ncbi:MAG: hypothetical protein ACM3X7_10125 [Solirubrobacterales bacterium]
MSNNSKIKKVKAFNDFLSKVLDVMCILWAIGWTAVGIKFMIQHNPIITLLVSFLYGSPALIYLFYRYTHFYKDKWMQKKTNNNLA